MTGRKMRTNCVLLVVIVATCGGGSSMQEEFAVNALSTMAMKAAFLPSQMLLLPSTCRRNSQSTSITAITQQQKPTLLAPIKLNTLFLSPALSFLPASCVLRATADDNSEGSTSMTSQAETEEFAKLTKEEAQEKVGNLVADDEWAGLSMELTELVRTAIIEDIKTQTRDFLGKDDYKVGDFSKELDTRVKGEVAKLRGKDEYELGDLSLALDTISKDLTCELTGKDDYEFGDLSIEIDKRIKSSVADFCGKDNYETGDLSREIDRRAKEFVAEFTSKDNYEFGDITNELNKRREEWVKNFTGKSSYEFGDVTKTALKKFTGKDDYEFGDLSKKLFSNVFGKRRTGKDLKDN